MVDLLTSLHFTPWQWAMAAFCGLAIGASKTGLAGVAFLAFPILADLFGTRVSTGVALPMLLLGDCFAVAHFNRHAHWKHLLRLMPWAVLGMLVALAVGERLSGRAFGVVFALTLLAGIGVMLWRDLRRREMPVPDRPWFPGIMGLMAGFATMIGNAAGPMMSLYLLSMRLPKAAFIGTAAWFYLTVNAVKVPLHLFVWNTVSLKTLAFNLTMAPFIGLGLAGGIAVVRRIPERAYRILVMATVTLAAALLVVKLLR